MKKCLSFCLLFSALVLVLGCSDKKDKNQEINLKPADSTTGIRPADFVWSKEVGQDLTYYYQPVDTLKHSSVQMRDKLVEIYHTISAMVGYTKPEQLEFYCYEDTATLKRYTGREEPFMIGNKCYYGYGPEFGVRIAEFVISKLPGGPTQYAFARDGLPLLLDYSGRNYHHATNNFITDHTITPLTTLTNNDKYAPLQGGQKLIESASFCGYIMYEYGYEKFMQIYHGTGDFESVVKTALGRDLAQLEKGWHLFLPEHTNEKEEERQKLEKETEKQKAGKTS